MKQEMRHVSPLAGAFNFRDLGGLVTRDGRVIKHGLLFRSDTLHALTSEDVFRLTAEIGIDAIVDLRQASEVADEGRGLLADYPKIRYVNAPLQMASGENVPPDEVLNVMYSSSISAGSMLASAVENVVAFAGHPTVFHCTAGKDRTGLVAAVVLRLLGIEDDAIVADYMASAPNMPRMLERFASWPRYRDYLAKMPSQVYAVNEAPIRRFLAELDKQFGGAHPWALSNGIQKKALNQLEQALLRTQ
jgi:protein-tyrosine phosphatase